MNISLQNFFGRAVSTPCFQILDTPLSGRPVRAAQFTTFCSVRMIHPLLFVVLCSCSCYRPSYSSDHWPYYRSCCWSSFCLASCCIVHALHDLLPTSTLQRPESVANLWNTTPNSCYTVRICILERHGGSTVPLFDCAKRLSVTDSN